jgi:hypothetical protein
VNPPVTSAPSTDWSRFEVILLGLFLACWGLSLLSFTHILSLAGSLPLALYPFYSVAVALGWAFGMLYMQRTRDFKDPQLRRRFLFIYYLGPPAILVLMRAMAPVAYQTAAPLVPLWAFGVFSILFLVPVTMKFSGRQ